MRRIRELRGKGRPDRPHPPRRPGRAPGGPRRPGPRHSGPR
jgi:hypothetical protein